MTLPSAPCSLTMTGINGVNTDVVDAPTGGAPTKHSKASPLVALKMLHIGMYVSGFVGQPPNGGSQSAAFVIFCTGTSRSRQMISACVAQRFIGRPPARHAAPNISRFTRAKAV